MFHTQNWKLSKCCALKSMGNFRDNLWSRRGKEKKVKCLMLLALWLMIGMFQLAKRQHESRNKKICYNFNENEELGFRHFLVIHSIRMHFVLSNEKWNPLRCFVVTRTDRLCSWGQHCSGMQRANFSSISIYPLLKNICEHMASTARVCVYNNSCRSIAQLADTQSCEWRKNP